MDFFSGLESIPLCIRRYYPRGSKQPHRRNSTLLDMFPRDSENSETDQFILEASDEAITLAAGTGLGCTGFCEESPEQDEGGSKGMRDMLARLKEAVEKGYKWVAQ